MLSCHTVAARDPARACVIWLHGLGADGRDFLNIPEHFKQCRPDSLRFIFPNAPKRPVTLNQGQTMTAWYDIKNIVAEPDRVGILNSVTAIHALIEHEIDQGLKPEQILLGGFSQGGAMALTAGLRFGQPLAGLIGLSCYLPDPILVTSPTLTTRTPIMMVHGSHDPIVPHSLGEHAYRTLKAQHAHIEFKSYPLGHSVDLGVLTDIDHFIAKHLS